MLTELSSDDAPDRFTSILPPTRPGSWGKLHSGAIGIVLVHQHSSKQAPVGRDAELAAVENTGWWAAGQHPGAPPFPQQTAPLGRSLPRLSNHCRHQKLRFCQPHHRSRSGLGPRCGPERRLSMIASGAFVHALGEARALATPPTSGRDHTPHRDHGRRDIHSTGDP